MNLKKLLVLIFIFTSFSTFAETRWFTVEVLIFERNVDMSKLQESIPKEHKLVDTSNSTELLLKQFNNDCGKDKPCLHQKNPIVMTEANFNKNSRFQLVSKNDWTLTNDKHALDKYPQFTTVFHGAWRMPITGENKEKPIHIFAGKNFALQELKQIQAKQKALDPTYKRTNSLQNDNKKSISNEQLAINTELDNLKDKWAIDGNIKIYLNHYLYIDSQLIVRREDAQNLQENKNTNGSDVNSEQQTPIIKGMLFDQKEKLRSDKIYYFDHPLMGMIIQIRKIP